MHSMLGHSCVAVALMAASLACAQDADLEEGKKLYEKECMVCHGFNNSGKTGENRWPRYRLARAQAAHVGATLVDAGETDVHLAVAPPFGPNLGGVYGRPAGTAEGFQYSAPFLKSLKGMVWDEGSLDVWLTSTQRWIPGVTMYYSQKNPDARRKIIQFLKANP